MYLGALFSHRQSQLNDVTTARIERPTLLDLGRHGRVPRRQNFYHIESTQELSTTASVPCGQVGHIMSVILDFVSSGSSNHREQVDERPWSPASEV